MQKNLPTRRVWAVMDLWASTIVYYLAILLILGAIEYSKGAFEKDAYQTYTFCFMQLPLQALVIYAATCMMHIGYHLVVLGKSKYPPTFLSNFASFI